MKKTLITCSIISLLLIVQKTDAQHYKTGLGVRLSSSQAIVNNSISLKHFISESTAIEGLFSFGDPLALGALVAKHKPLGTTGLNWFYGAGGYIGFSKSYNPNTNKNESDPSFGAMGTVGLDYRFANAPLNLSLDWKPELNMVSDFYFEPAAIGFTARFIFK